MTTFLDQLIPSFRRELKYRNLVAGSIKNYERTFNAYRHWCGIAGYSFDLAIDNYIEWSEWLQENYKPRTVNLYLTLMRSFATWAHGEGEISFSLPRLAVDPGPRKPQIIPDDVLKRLIDIAKQSPRRIAIRDELIVRLLLDTGVRRFELGNVRIKDINFDDMSIWIMGKGGKARFVYYGNNSGRALDRYLRVRPQFALAGSEWLLLGQRGRLGEEGIRKLIERLRDAAGLADLRPHMFRHTFAHDWLDNGGSERDLMRVAGWSTVSMLNVYGSEKADQRASGSHKRLSRGDRI